MHNLPRLFKLLASELNPKFVHDFQTHFFPRQRIQTALPIFLAALFSSFLLKYLFRVKIEKQYFKTKSFLGIC